MMQAHCPVCGGPLGRHEIVCGSCRQRIAAREPVRRHNVLYGWGRGLMLFLAACLFLKGAFAALGPSDYADLARSFGVQSVDRTAQFLNAAFVVAAALLYAIAWLGGYVGRAWDSAACLAALVVFLVGQALTNLLGAAKDGYWAQALALFAVWVSLPVVQYAAFRLGSPEKEQALKDSTDGTHSVQ
jgi:predicted nucleic acid-binding Zn ribbon protein